MGEYTYKRKRCLCYTNPSDFTDIQGVGKDPAYLRYNSVQSVVNRLVAPAYHHFLAASDYQSMEDRIYWHVDEWKERPVRLVELTGAERDRYEDIKKETVNAYLQAVNKAEGDDLTILIAVLKYRPDDFIYCADGKVWLVAWGMTLDQHKHKVSGQVIHEVEIINKWTLTFNPGLHGKLVNAVDRVSKREEGYVVKETDLPLIVANEGWIFDGWEPTPVGVTLMADQTFVARYLKVKVEPEAEPEPVSYDDDEEEEMLTCRFDAGEHGTLQGQSEVYKWPNEQLSYDEIPTIEPEAGYRFVGWDIPTSNSLTQDVVFTALYKRVPWYKRLWAWITGKGCLKWLMWFLLLLLFLWLLSFLVDSCRSCTNRSVNGVVPSDTITNAKGKRVDDNGFAHPVTGNDGELPADGAVVAPVLGEGGTELPIVQQPGMPSIIANRLVLFMEDSSGDLEGLARDFKKAYPDDQYAIIGYDKEVKMLVLRVPEGERAQLRQSLNNQLPNHRFFVFDEEVYSTSALKNSTSNLERGWHLSAIRLSRGWRITRGSADVKVAIVDDGIDAAHPMFANRIVEAYNVFRQDNQLSLGEGHGTHTAALAVGSEEFFRKGAAGVAPLCQLMPVQVFDNNYCPLSALVAGVMYAIHHDADVINMSVGPSFKGLNQLPVEQQQQIARDQFHNQARLWKRICELALAKQSILVIAAGNDDVLASIPPANRAEAAIVVTSVDEKCCPTNFTNYGPCSDISAPGTGIYSAFPRSSFSSQDGTSMSAPIVAGVVALMKSLKKDLTAEQARNVLYRTGADVYGYIPPMVQVDKALESVQRGDFSKPKVREIRPVPGFVPGEGSASGAVPPETVWGDDPSGGIATPGGAGTSGQGDSTEGSNSELPSGSSSPLPSSGSDEAGEGANDEQRKPNDSSKESDYDAIRRKIKEYKQKIAELEKLLPQS